jgi:formate hydrogenlyase subunit 3/multisubunit Na+/H+ antiporter MnhD subunit
MTASFGPALLVLTLLAPTALLAACGFSGLRRAALAVQWAATIPAILAALVALLSGPIAFEAPALRLSLSLDARGAMLLLMSALLWAVSSAGAFAGRGDERGGLYAISWLLTMIGSFGVFIANDLVSFYLVYALVSIPAWGLIALDDRPETNRTSALYMAFAILGEAFLLMAFVLLAAAEPNGSLRIADGVAALPASPWEGATIALLIAGFGAKMGLIPLNGWMPLTYAAAPIPAAAVLSGAGVKAGVIGLIRFLPLGAPLAGWGEALAALGFLSAFYGAAVGLTQRNPKAILAYSSISQMGVIAAALGMALTSGDANAQTTTAFYAANHVLVKGALFLTIGAFATNGKIRPTWAIVLAAVLALSLAGLPFTGGALAKGVVKPLFGSGLAGTLGNLSSIASGLLMLRFVVLLPKSGEADPATVTPAALVRFWPAIALGAIFVPYALAPAAGGFADAFTLGKLWDSLWPILIGAALAFGLTRSGLRLPAIPVGDTASLWEAAFQRCLEPAALFDPLDKALRRWPAAALALVAVALALAAAAYASVG